jgi:hypothetical protein
MEPVISLDPKRARTISFDKLDILQTLTSLQDIYTFSFDLDIIK